MPCQCAERRAALIAAAIAIAEGRGGDAKAELERATRSVAEDLEAARAYAIARARALARRAARGT